MKFLELERTLTITVRKINNIETIQAKIESQLNAIKLRTDLADYNVITFKTIGINIVSGLGYSAKSYLLLRIYKEGKIVIDKEGKTLKIRWTVRLDTLYVLAIDSSIVAGITSSLYLDTEQVIALGFGVLFFLSFVFLGVQFIGYKLSELIYACVYRS